MIVTRHLKFLDQLLNLNNTQRKWHHSGLFLKCPYYQIYVQITHVFLKIISLCVSFDLNKRCSDKLGRFLKINEIILCYSPRNLEKSAETQRKWAKSKTTSSAYRLENIVLPQDNISNAVIGSIHRMAKLFRKLNCKVSRVTLINMIQ